MVLKVVARKGASAPYNLCLHKSLLNILLFTGVLAVFQMTLLYVPHVFMCCSYHCMPLITVYQVGWFCGSRIGCVCQLRWPTCVAKHSGNRHA